MRLRRMDPLLNDFIEALDVRLQDAKRTYPKASIEEQTAYAWTLLTPLELNFIKEEITHCIDSRVYYLGNYHVIQPEQGILTCMAPLYDLQYVIEEALEKKLKEEGQAQLVIQKPRQSGGTEYCNGVICQRTFFLPHSYTITVAQDPSTSAHVQRKALISHEHLPWWMRVERQYMTKGEFLEFNRKDVAERSFDPGMASVLVTTHAMRETGVAIGRTVRTSHLTEVSRWPSGEVWTADIEPSMNAPDKIALAESTPWGANGFFYNLCQEAMEGDSEWTYVFLPAYRARKYSLPLKPSQRPFALTPDEQKLKARVQIEERFVITDEFFNWRRRRVKAAIRRTGYAYAHYECYAVTPREGFQSSGHTAFARHKLDEQEANIRKPEWVGEILFQGRGTVPKVRLNHMIDRDGHYLDIPLEKREYANRLYLWQYPPDPTAHYYLAADAGEGIGQDLSVAQIMRAGFQNEPDLLVGNWVGYEPPEAFARIVYSLATLYNRCEAAVEYQGPGRATADYLKNQLEYPNLYIPRNTDRYKNQLASYLHWQTTSKTKPLLRNKMNETLLENGIIIPCEYTLNEMRACEAEGESFAAGEGRDDAAMSLTICLYCLRQTMPELRPPTGEPTGAAGASSSTPLVRSLHPALGAVIYAIYDEAFRMRAQKRVLAEAEELASQHSGWQVRPLMVTKANTAYSPIYHGRGLERELLQSGMQDRAITPDLLTVFGAATGRDGLGQVGMRQQADGQVGRQGGLAGMAGLAGAASPGAEEAMWDGTLGDWGDLV